MQPIANNFYIFHLSYLYCSGNGLSLTKIDLNTGKLIGSIQKFLDKREPGYPEWMVGGIEGHFMYDKRPYPYCPDLQPREKTMV